MINESMQIGGSKNLIEYIIEPYEKEFKMIIYNLVSQ